jgi:hypothetical protein
MQSFLVMTAGGAAGVVMLRALMCGTWLSAGLGACILLVAVATAKPEPTNTFHHHTRRALRAAGILAGLSALAAAASFVIPSNIAEAKRKSTAMV